MITSVVPVIVPTYYEQLCVVVHNAKRTSDQKVHKASGTK